MLQMSNQKYRRTNFDEEDQRSSVVTNSNENNSNSNLGRTASELPSPSSTIDPTVSFQHYKLNFWRRRSYMEKFLLLFLLLLLLIIFILTIILSVKNKQLFDQISQTEMCLDKACITAASNILNSMDESVDPCEDFYSFACGAWERKHPIPPGHARWDAFSLLKEKNFNILREIIEREDHTNMTQAELKAVKYYKSCLGLEEQRANKSLVVLENWIRNVGGWSISNFSNVTFDPVKNSTQLQKRLAYLFNEPIVYIFFGIGIQEDEANPDENVIKIEQYRTSLMERSQNETQDNKKKNEAFFRLMVDISRNLGAGEDNETLQRIRDVFELEKSLDKLILSPEEKKIEEKNYNIESLVDLQTLLPIFNWTIFINDIVAESNITINQTERIVIITKKFLSGWNDIMDNLMKSEKGRRIIQDYMVWNLIFTMGSWFSKDLEDLKSKHYKELLDIFGEEEQWKQCMMDLEGVLGFAVGSMFVKKTFDPDSKQSAFEMIHRIKDSFREKFPYLSWMDEATRKLATHKVEKVDWQVGYPDYLLNVTELDAQHEMYKINENEYAMNRLRIKKATKVYLWSKLREPSEKNSWNMPPSEVNAYYSPIKNQMAFPAGILQGIFYNKNYPDSLNYGGIGVVVGHELTHGFDDQGSNYNAEGIKQKWWKDEIMTNFRERTTCLVNQYDQYRHMDMPVNGNLTLGENIADNGGLKSAYYAFMRILRERHGKDKLLPGVPYDQKQLFFISFAQVWCTNLNHPETEKQVKEDGHALPMFRVVGSLSNFKEFSETFNCPINSKMNPPHKCEVW